MGDCFHDLFILKEKSDINVTFDEAIFSIDACSDSSEA